MFQTQRLKDSHLLKSRGLAVHSSNFEDNILVPQEMKDIIYAWREPAVKAIEDLVYKIFKLSVSVVYGGRMKNIQI